MPHEAWGPTNCGVGQIRAQLACLAQVDVMDLVDRSLCVPVNEHADAAWQAMGDSHFLQAEQRGARPT